MILYDHIHKVRKQKHVAGIKNIPKRSKIDVYTHTCIYIYTCVCMLNIYIYILLSALHAEASLFWRRAATGRFQLNSFGTEGQYVTAIPKEAAGGRHALDCHV